MNKKIILLSAILLSAVASAQVKIGGTDGTPNASSMLHVDATHKGMILPRLALVETTNFAPLSQHDSGLTAYNTATAHDVVPGFYYNDGTKWQQMVTTDNKAVKFFYMPSITFDTSADATGQTKDLYEEYKAQFALTNPNHVVSPGAPANGIPYFD